MFPTQRLLIQLSICSRSAPLKTDFFRLRQRIDPPFISSCSRPIRHRMDIARSRRSTMHTTYCWNRPCPQSGSARFWPDRFTYGFYCIIADLGRRRFQQGIDSKSRHRSTRRIVTVLFQSHSIGSSVGGIVVGSAMGCLVLSASTAIIRIDNSASGSGDRDGVFGRWDDPDHPFDQSDGLSSFDLDRAVGRVYRRTCCRSDGLGWRRGLEPGRQHRAVSVFYNVIAVAQLIMAPVVDFALTEL